MCRPKIKMDRKVVKLVEEETESEGDEEVELEIAKADKCHRVRQDLYPIESEIYPKFNDIRLECLKRGILFEDPDFPAAESSLATVGELKKPINWLRPHEIQNKPLFLKDYQLASRFDVVQGELGDCWLLVAIANLTLFPELLQKVIPTNQSFTRNYAGIFHFRFWDFGKWVDIIVDDRLPTYNGKLIYLQSASGGEFWPCLLEKAYAKMHGSYEALIAGKSSEAMKGLTGGIAEFYTKRSGIPEDFFDIILNSFGRTSLMACNIDKSTPEYITSSDDPDELPTSSDDPDELPTSSDDPDELPTSSDDPDELPTSSDDPDELPNGLYANHGYSVTGVEKVKTKNGQFVKLIRLRNPWGNQRKWVGAWSDRSEEWELLSKKTKRRLDLKFQYDGEFWMDFDDFIEQFTVFEIVLLVPGSITAENLLEWEVSQMNGEWTLGVNAAGCLDVSIFHLNPQFRITVDCDETIAENKCPVTIALLQKFKRTRSGSEMPDISYYLYHLEDADLKFDVQPKNFFCTHDPCAPKPCHRNIPEVSARYTLPPGVYLIVPCTYDPNQEGSFLLRVFSVLKNRLEQQDVTNDFVKSPKIERSLTEEKIEKFVKMSEKIFCEKGHTEIHWHELKEILTRFFATISIKYEMSDEIFRSAFALVDTDHNGRIDVNEFRVLVKYLMRWKTAFDNAEKDENGNLAPFQLAETMKLLRYQLSSEVFCALSHRYATEHGAFEFPNFILCAIKVTVFMNTFTFRANDSKRATIVSDWFKRIIYS